MAAEAESALLNFPNRQAVSHELERVADADAEFVSPRGQVHFANLQRNLVYWNVEPSYEPMLAWSISDKAREDMKTKLKPKLERQLLKSPALEGAQDTVDAMNFRLTDLSSLANWQRVLGQIDRLTEDAQETVAGCLISALDTRYSHPETMSRETLLALHDPLRAVARNEKLNGPLRLAAMLGLHRDGDDSLREVVFRDIISPQTIFLNFSTGGFGGSDQGNNGPAAEILGSYRSKEIGKHLVAEIKALTPNTSPENWARWNSLVIRLRDFGSAVKPTQLRDVYQKIVRDAPPQESSGRLKRITIEVMALVTPDDAVGLIHNFPRTQARDYEGHQFLIKNVLTRLPTPAAHALRDEILAGTNEDDRTDLISGLGHIMWEAQSPYSVPSWTRTLPARADIVISTVPTLIHIFETDPSPLIHDSAKNALSSITGIPGDSGPQHPIKNPDEKTEVSQWKDWLAKQGKVKKQSALKK